MQNLLLTTGPAFYGLLGVLIGTLGTLVGAGGGFILVPILLYLMPHEDPDRITAISMAVVFFNALSGSVAYARMGRIDFKAGSRFSLAALPGALLGAVATSYISREWFDRVLGITLVLIAIYLLFKNVRKKGTKDSAKTDNHKTFILDKSGQRKGEAISAGVGFVSSALGIGGGIVHVPALTYILGFPVHIATATSHFVLACTTFIVVIEHAVRGSYAENVAITAALSIGALIGAQFGARLSTRMNGRFIIIALALALIFAGSRIIFRSMF